MTESQELIEILLVEDNPGDALLTREAFDEARVRNNLHHVTDGVRAMEFLRREGEYERSPRPDIILLDLNMPRKGGLEVLEEVKNDPRLKDIPVVVLTTSAAEEDVVRSYQAHANAYITKPVDLAKFLSVVRTLEEFWLAVVRLPPRRDR
jgi:chemotaxis family two-component system response regulator Rcp1